MISIIVPAYNDEKFIAETLRKLQQVSKRIGGEILVIDDGSRDKTAAVAEKYAKVFRNGRNRGKGAAMRVGAEKAKGSTLIFIDASQFDPLEIPKLLAAMEKGKVKMAVGARDFSIIPWNRKITNALTKLAIFMGTGKRVEDALSGFRVIGRKDFLSLGTKEDRYSIESEINFKALLKNWRVRFVPVTVVYSNMPHMRLGSTKTSLLNFLNQRFLHEAVFNIKSVLKIWLLGRM